MKNTSERLQRFKSTVMENVTPKLLLSKTNLNLKCFNSCKSRGNFTIQ